MTVVATGTFNVVGAGPALALFGPLTPRRLAHGYLFTGPSGGGKKHFARSLAQSLLCERPKPTLLGFCNDCTGCTLFVARTHPDLIEAVGAIKIGERAVISSADEITARDVGRALGLRPYRAAWRILLLGDVSFAAPAAANALLKFFEEPPVGVLVILTTDAPDRLLDTIRSRMVTVSFPPLSAAEIADVLRRSGVSETDAARAARTAQGSLTAAKAALDQTRTSLRSSTVAWFADTVAGNRADVEFLRLDDKGLAGAEKRELLVDFVSEVRVAMRDLAVLTMANVAMVTDEERARFARSPRGGGAELEAMISSLIDAQRIAATNVSPALVVDYVRMCLTPSAARVTAVRSRQGGF